MKKFTMNKIIISISTILCAATFASSIFAHGYVAQPASRAYLCKEGKNTNCGSVQWEPQSIEAPTADFGTVKMDGHIASGMHANFSALDEQSATRWQKVTMHAGTYDFVWHHTAIHSTANYRFYITDWKPGDDNANKPLTRASFGAKPFCSKELYGTKPGSDITIPCAVPERTGYQVILAVWQIADTQMSFYQVIDVDFSGAPQPEPAAADWQSSDATNWLASSNLGDVKAGDEISLAIKKDDVTEHNYMVMVSNLNQANWQAELAAKINNANSNQDGLVCVGLLDNATAEVNYRDYADNKIYFNHEKADAQSAYSYSWSKKSQPIEPTQTWTAVGQPLSLHEAKVESNVGLKLRTFDSAGQELSYNDEPIAYITDTNKASWQKALATAVNNHAYRIPVKIGILSEDKNSILTPDSNYADYKVYVASSADIAKQYSYEIDTVKKPVVDYACKYHFNVTNNWGSGFQAELSITNASATAIDGWNISFPINAAVTKLSGWNGKFTLENGEVKISNDSWNKAIAANAQLSGIGFTAELNQAVSTEALGLPTLALNGQVCQHQ
jgi:predicted carbohydrate-binding protein with CBM5 and CBM33 domain